MQSNLIKIDEYIRSGHHGLAKELLVAELEKNHERSNFVELASFTRRLGVPEKGLALLSKIVRPGPRSTIQSTDAERGEYAGCLIRMGVTKEARDLLDTVDVDLYPRALLLKGLAFLAEWNYQKAIAPLTEFSTRPDTFQYEKLVSKVNLVAAFVFLGSEDLAESLITEIKREAAENKNNLLHSNALYYEAKCKIQKNRWTEAEELLKEASALLQSSNTLDSFLLRKEKAILDLKRNPMSAKNRAALAAVKKEATERMFWESVRDCDFHRAILTKDKRLVLRLIFGTPHLAYRERVIKESSLGVEDLPRYYTLTSGQNKNCQRFDSESGEVLDSSYFLKQDQVCHRLMRALLSDFYKPKKIMDLYADIFPDQIFSSSSKDQVYQACYRLRKFFNESKLGLRISEKNGLFTLSKGPGKSVEILISAEPSKVSGNLKKLIGQFRNKKSFKAQQFAEELKLPSRTARRLLKEASESGLIKKFGRGPATFYSSQI